MNLIKYTEKLFQFCFTKSARRPTGKYNIFESSGFVTKSLDSPIQDNYPTFPRLSLSLSLVLVDLYSVPRRLIDFGNLVGFSAGLSKA